MSMRARKRRFCALWHLGFHTDHVWFKSFDGKTIDGKRAPAYHLYRHPALIA
jgi:hypothetical protein